VKVTYAILMAFQLGFLVALTICFFIMIGFFIDEYFQSQPYFMIIGLVGGGVMVVWEGKHLLKPLMVKEKKKNA
jgi:F0F1-type ATP synthase assembly protein I